MADSTISALSAASAVASDNEFVVNEAGVSKKVSATQIKTFITTGGTVTADAPVLNVTQTWNNAGVTFTAFKVNATSTASAAASMLADFQLASSSKAYIDKNGTYYTNGGSLLTSQNLGVMGAASASNYNGVFGAGASGVRMVGNWGITWTSQSAGAVSVFGGTADIGLMRSAAGILVVTNASTGGGALEFREQTAPAAPSTNNVRLYAQDNGSGKTQLMALFPTGTAVQLAIEP